MITKQQPYNQGNLALSSAGVLWNAGIYCRLSVEDQNLQESGSIQTQKIMLTDYCRQSGINVVDYYIDDGVSGTTFDRPGFRQMVSDIEAGKINTVVTKEICT